MTSVPFAREGSRLRLVSTVWPSRWARHPALADGASTRHRMPAAASHTLRTRNPAHQQSRSGSQVRLQRYPMTADIRLAVSVIRTVFAQNHRAAATAADGHARERPNKRKNAPPPATLREGRCLTEFSDDLFFFIAESPYGHILRGLQFRGLQFRGLALAQEIAAAVDGLLHGPLRV